MLSSYPGSSRIAFEYYSDGLARVNFHLEGVELEHRALGALGALGLGLVLSRSVLSQSFLAQLVLGMKIFIHPEQLLDSTSLVGQLEGVIIGVQAEKEETGMEGTQLWDALLSFLPLGFTTLQIFKK